MIKNCILLLFVFLCSCARESLEEKQPTMPVQEKNVTTPFLEEDKIKDIEKKMEEDIKDEENTEEEQEEEEEMEVLDNYIYTAANNLHSIFKIKTQGLLYRYKMPIYILLKKKQDGKPGRRKNARS